MGKRYDKIRETIHPRLREMRLYVPLTTIFYKEIRACVKCD